MRKTTGLLLGGAVLLVAAHGPALAAEPLRTTRAVQVNKGDLVPTRTYSSPTVLVDPRNRLRAVAAFVDMRSRRCGLMRSLDGGQTWKQLDASPSPPSYPFCFHTSGGVTQTPLAFGRDGTLYYGLTGWDTQDGGNRSNVSVLLARSTDLGDTWRTTIVRNARGKTGAEVENNRPVSSVVVDSRGDKDVVYVAWRANYPEARPSRPSLPMVAVSTDGGETFSEPLNAIGTFFESAEVRAAAVRAAPPTTATTAVPTTPPPARDAVGNFGGGNPQVAVDGKGTLYVLWVRATANIEPRPEQPMYISRSTDRGRTFQVSEVSPASNWYGGPVLKWSSKGGEQGTLHLVYEDKLGQTQGDRDIFYRQSTDGGRTWSDARVLHDDEPKQLIGQFIPNLAVAPDGRVDVAWWDFRNDPGLYVNDVYMTSSTDNGRTWSKNLRVTDRSINRRIGPWSNNFDMRQPPGIGAADAYTLLAWDDTRNGDPVGQAQDIFSAAVQHKVISSGASNPLRYALAAVTGLLAVGLLLLLVAGLGRRRMSPTQPTPAVTETETVRVS